MSLLSRLAVQAARAYGILSARSTNVSADYLVVAGGGGGGAFEGAGGGAGGFLTSTATLSTLNTYSITVGSGGTSAGSSAGAGNNGSNSVISGTGLSTITSVGGGGGGGLGSQAGKNGGSGGGASSNSTTVGLATAGQGNNGGLGTGVPSSGTGGGGGGAGEAGNTDGAGYGGDGLASSISGSSVIYAGGGAGYNSSGSQGGTGGGGNQSTSGTVNTGGGGGAWDGVTPAGAGGSGIVIISYTSATPKFVGGTITTSGGKQIHTFTSSGTLSPITPITAEYLVVAGGGAGGYVTGNNRAAGGGGAGGLLTGSTTIYSGATYVVTVGGGGTSTTSSNTNGSNSVLSGTGLTTITSTGGGSGGSTFPDKSAANGGSGGGGNSGSSSSGGTGTSGQGNNGGNGSGNFSGGGGGAGAVGNNASGSASGAGGAGTASSISGSSVTYAGGGGGGMYNGSVVGAGGAGGGGAGTGSATGTAGTANTGGGGGGTGPSGTVDVSFAGGAGGSGIVIISYAGSQQFNGGLVTSSGGNTIHTFTSTGALTPLTNNLTNSLRFRSSASAYLSRTPASASNRKTWTWSGWVKKAPIQGSANTLATLMGCTTGSTDSTYLRFGFYQDKFIVGNNSAFFLQSTPLYRDPSAWYHVVVSTDTNQGSASNRMRIYINGNEVTAWSTDQRSTYLTSSVDLAFNQASQHSIGSSLPNAGDYFDGYMTDINFIDGQALEPYYFGNNDANGVWKPIQYKGTYGINGFYLNFSNTTSTTTLGFDSSPNGNNWTTNNISLTAGTTYDAMTDVPTNTSATVANYAVLDPLDPTTSGNATLSNANLTLTTSAANRSRLSSIGITSGKWYAEVIFSTSSGSLSGCMVGICQSSDVGSVVGSYLGSTANSYGYNQSGDKYNNASNSAYGASYTSNDVIGIAFDADNGTLTFYKNNTSQGTAYSSLSTSATWFIGVSGGISSASANIVINANFGQRPFAYTPPTGFVALNTFNLPTPTILQGNKYMDATAYSGTNVTNVIVNQGQFRPDFVWCKGRSASGSWHALFDTVRGATKGISTNSTDAEYTSTAGNDLASFNSNGFTVGTTQNWGSTNQAGQTMVGWQWQAGQGSTSSNTSGSITSTVSVNTTAGFSIVTYTGTGSVATVGHGLGVAPRMVIVKSRSAGSTDWVVYHASLGATQNVRLQSTAAAATQTVMWNDTAPTSTVFTIGTNNNVNTNAQTQVAYCWAEIAGFSAFGSYTGNGSADGPFIFTGFRPKFIMRKQTTNNGDVGGWIMFDTSRDTFNVATRRLLANSSNAEATPGNNIDILSNGWKERSSDGYSNASGQTYIYMAFAENPFKNSNAR